MYSPDYRIDLKTPQGSQLTAAPQLIPLFLVSSLTGLKPFGVFQSIFQLFGQQNWSHLTTIITKLTGCLLILVCQISHAQTPDEFDTALHKLQQGGMAEREQAIDWLATDKRSLNILQALQEGKLFELKSESKLVTVQESTNGYLLKDVVSGIELSEVERSAVGKLNLTNKLRSSLRKAIAQLQLNETDPAIRLTAVQALGKDVDDKALVLLSEHLNGETDTDIQLAIQEILVLKQLDSQDRSQRLAAVNTVKTLNSQAVLNRLETLTDKDAEGHFLEPDNEIRDLADAALSKIKTRIMAYAAVETVFFGLSLGAVLVLSAIGLAITFGVMGIINMAHGELMMLGAYTTYVMQKILPNQPGVALILSIPAAFLVAGLVGVAIERGIIRFLYGRPLETLLATFGVSLFLQQLVRSIFSPLNRSVTSPTWMSGSWQINDFLSLTWNRLYILIFCLLVFTALLQILKRTKLGLEVRAVAQNRKMAKAMGIPTARVDAMTFGLGSGIAGVAGVALSQITNVGPNLGQAYIVDSFMVVVFGGVGNLFGTLVAGFTLGIANKVLEPYAGAVLAKILVLVFIILFIQKRPRGLFPQKGRAAEN
ncbi:urea ABC transporter permease subunit UrtB [Methylomonas paludis]|nr:urea ABC transporter permease subunit UrtB [Methylomonas paludis]